MSSATSISDAQEQVNTLANCDCCGRHNENKPRVFEPLECAAPQQRSMSGSGDCTCDCRHCREYPVIVAVEIAEAMLMLSTDRPRMLNAHLLEEADVCESENGEGCVEHAAAMRVAARDPAWANWRQDEVVPDQPDQGFACSREDQCEVCRRQALAAAGTALVRGLTAVEQELEMLTDGESSSGAPMAVAWLATAALLGGGGDPNSKCRSCNEFVCSEHHVNLDGVIVCVDCEWYV